MCTYFRPGVGEGSSLKDASIASGELMLLCDFTPFIPSLFSLYDYDSASLVCPCFSLEQHSVILVPMIPCVPN